MERLLKRKNRKQAVRGSLGLTTGTFQTALSSSKSEVYCSSAINILYLSGSEHPILYGLLELHLCDFFFFIQTGLSLLLVSDYQQIEQSFLDYLTGFLQSKSLQKSSQDFQLLYLSNSYFYFFFQSFLSLIISYLFLLFSFSVFSSRQYFFFFYLYFYLYFCLYLYPYLYLDLDLDSSLFYESDAYRFFFSFSFSFYFFFMQFFALIYSSYFLNLSLSILYLCLCLELFLRLSFLILDAILLYSASY